MRLCSSRVFVAHKPLLAVIFPPYCSAARSVWIDTSCSPKCTDIKVEFCSSGNLLGISHRDS
jgi:hypothetical protein